MSVFSRLWSRLSRGKATSQARILLLVDYRDWAFDISAKEIATRLCEKYEFDIRYVNDTPSPTLNASRYDLIYVFFWGERYHQQFGFSPLRTIKEVSSHRWEDDERFGPCSPEEMTQRFLSDARTVICTSKRLQSLVGPYVPRTFHTPNGICTEKFFRKGKRTGAMTFGWAGNANDPVKGLEDVLKPALAGVADLQIASGNVSHERMLDFYNELDVFLVSSRHEGEPLTLLEAMASGCFPICSDVGIASELIETGENGIIVKERTQSEFRAAVRWCLENPEYVRRMGELNAAKVREERSWNATIAAFDRLFSDTLEFARTNH